MMIIYTPGERIKAIVQRFRSERVARETFTCEWFINRDEQMDFVLQRGCGRNENQIRVCLMLGEREQITDDMIQGIAPIISKLLDKYKKTPKWIRFGFKKGEGPEVSEHLEKARLHLIQELTIERECIKL